MSNGMPLRVIRRIKSTVWCIPVTRFLEDKNEHKRVKDELDLDKKVSYICVNKQCILVQINASKPILKKLSLYIVQLKLGILNLS